MRQWRHVVAGIILSGTVSLVYNGCGNVGGFDALAPNPTNSGAGSTLTTSPASDQLSLGQALYEKHCAVCHNTLSNSTKLGKQASDITNAFKTISPMAQLSFLTNEQVAQIALALNSTSLSLTNDSGASFRILISNRYLLTSQLMELFVNSTNPDTNDTTIQNTINSLIMNHPEGFGGNCTRNDPGCVPNPCASDGACRGKLNTNQNAEVNPSSSPVRKGYLIQSCEKILTIDKAVTNLAAKASIDVTQAPDSVTLKKLALFTYRDRPQDDSSINQLLTLANSAKAANMNILDQWRFVMLALCQSSSADLL
ncbi:MAG: c-type cytochrome [Bdellovibrio sp.]